jgi:hypothetical protein
VYFRGVGTAIISRKDVLEGTEAEPTNKPAYWWVPLDARDD